MPDDATPALPWVEGPTRGNDPTARDEVECGDRFLVLVGVRTRYKLGWSWEPHVITATEDGWDDANGDSWSAWDWADVEWFIKLDRRAMPAKETP